jgi:hypothetical protein
MSGNMRLKTTCTQCGATLSVLTRQERPSIEHPGERVEVPMGQPICPQGHMYRVAAGAAYPE